MYKRQCRYCGKEPGELTASGELATESSPGSSNKTRILLAVIVLVILAAAAAVYFTQIYDREEYSDGVKSVELKNSYVLEDNKLSLADPTAR